MIIVCKKWHVAKRLLSRIRQVTNVPTIEYLFNEEDTPLPDLCQSTLALPAPARSTGQRLRDLARALPRQEAILGERMQRFDALAARLPAAPWRRWPASRCPCS